MLAQLIPPPFLDSNPRHLHNHYSTLILATLFPFTQKWWTLRLQHSLKLQFFVISSSNVCRITISWYIKPTINFYIFSNLRHTILNTNVPLFCQRFNLIQSNFWVRPTKNIQNFNLYRQCFPYRNKRSNNKEDINSSLGIFILQSISSYINNSRICLYGCMAETV